jgi:hypothetical protein
MGDSFKHDYKPLVEAVLAHAPGTGSKTPLVCLDECVRGPAVKDLVLRLCEDGLAAGTMPLWNERRIRQDGSILYVWGGVDRSRPFSNAGIPDKASWDDQEVVYTAVSQLYDYPRVVILTENTKRDTCGLRDILNKQVAPLLSPTLQQTRSLTTLFVTIKQGKKGKGAPDYETYSRRVTEFFKSGQFEVGYSELQL